jgi:phosphate transport system permease protein
MKDIKKRQTISSIFLLLSTFSAFLGIFWLIFILGDLLIEGASSINWALFTQDFTPPGMGGGGMRPAFIGQIIIVFVAVIIGIPIGLLGGTFIAEFGRNSKIAAFISVLSDLAISIPSIVIGTFVYAVYVRPSGHFSGFAGSLALSFIMIPVMLKTTENMLKLVPWNLREAAFALGAPYYKVILQIVYRSALTGLLTGTILSIARIAGETAPLLFTSLNNSFLSYNLNQPMASLTVTIYRYAMGPYDNWHRMAWAASFVITIFVLISTITGKLLIRWRYKK